MPLQVVSDLIADALIRSNEPTDGSSFYQAKCLDWINRGYNAIGTGTLEHTPETHVPWWWLWSKSPGVITLIPNYGQGLTDATANMTRASPIFYLSEIPVDVTGAEIDLTGWNIKFIGGSPASVSLDVFKIAIHGAGNLMVTLDSPYTGPTTPAANFNAFMLEYALPEDLQYVIAPLRTYQSGRERIDVLSRNEMERMFPLTQTTFGIPNMGALIGEQTIRFSHYVGAGTSTMFVRVDFDYVTLPQELSPADTSLLPQNYNTILSDYVMQQVCLAKNDDRAQSVGELIKGKITAMRREHVNRVWRTADAYGRIYARQQDRASIRGPWRTESGYIIGF